MLSGVCRQVEIREGRNIIGKERNEKLVSSTSVRVGARQEGREGKGRKAEEGQLYTR